MFLRLLLWVFLWVFLWVLLQAAAYYLRLCMGVGQQHARLTRDTAALAKTAVPPPALAAIPEPLLIELQAASVLADVRKAAAAATAKGAVPGVCLCARLRVCVWGGGKRG